METVYIKFEVPHEESEIKNENVFIRFLKMIVFFVLTKFIPVANPDFEGLFDEVNFWLVECDKISGIPQREIGLDSKGQVIMKMPFKNNYGNYTDSNALLSDFHRDFQVSEISKDSFECYWCMLQ